LIPSSLSYFFSFIFLSAPKTTTAMWLGAVPAAVAARIYTVHRCQNVGAADQIVGRVGLESHIFPLLLSCFRTVICQSSCIFELLGKWDSVVFMCSSYLKSNAFKKNTVIVRWFASSYLSFFLSFFLSTTPSPDKSNSFEMSTARHPRWKSRTHVRSREGEREREKERIDRWSVDKICIDSLHLN
jgi:hypothetical protein